jgi:hypothetical protein
MSRDTRDDPNGTTTPRVTRVTPEGRVIYDPLSVIRSGPFRKHIRDLVKNNPVQPKRAPHTTP